MKVYFYVLACLLSYFFFIEVHSHPHSEGITTEDALETSFEKTNSKTLKNDQVFHLTNENFDTYVNEPNSIWILDFYAPWCGHCKRLKPELEKFASLLPKHSTLSNIRVGMVDCDSNSSICSRFKVHGYPTIHTYRDKVHTIYRGPRTSEGFISHAKLTVVPPVRPFHSIAQTTDDLVKSYDAGALAGTAFIYLGGPGVYMKVFQRTAVKSSGEALFYAPGGTWHVDRIKSGLQNEDIFRAVNRPVNIGFYTPEEYTPVINTLKQLVYSEILTLQDKNVPEEMFAVPKEYTTETERQIVRNILNEMPLVLALVPSAPPVILRLKGTPTIQEEESEPLEHFIARHKHPLVSPLNAYNYEDILQGKSLQRKGILFATTRATPDNLRALMPLAAKYRSVALVAYLNADDYPGFYEQYGITSNKQLPTIIVVDYYENNFYVPEKALEENRPLRSVKEMEDFVETVLGPGDSIAKKSTDDGAPVVENEVDNTEKDDGDKNHVDNIHVFTPTATPRPLTPWWKFAKVFRWLEKYMDELTVWAGSDDSNLTYISISVIILFTIFIAVAIIYLLQADQVNDEVIDAYRKSVVEKKKQEDKAKLERRNNGKKSGTPAVSAPTPATGNVDSKKKEDATLRQRASKKE